jgi:uncharacterized BrkB/YihY/UPF0761 family membrane protein
MRSIARLLLWIFPFFGIVYVLGWRKVLGRDEVFIGMFYTMKLLLLAVLLLSSYLSAILRLRPCYLSVPSPIQKDPC